MKKEELINEIAQLQEKYGCIIDFNINYDIFNDKMYNKIVGDIFSRNEADNVLHNPLITYFQYEIYKFDICIYFERAFNAWEARVTYLDEEDVIETNFDFDKFNDMIEMLRDEILAGRKAIKETEYFLRKTG